MSSACLVDSSGYDIFISYYSGTGKDFARYLKKTLKDFSISAFLDEADIPKSIKEETDEWRSIVDASIKVSNSLILVMTLGFNKRKEVLRELRIAFESKKKAYFFKHETLGNTDLIVDLDGRVVDLSKFEYVEFSNDSDLLRKVIAALLGKIGQEKKSAFTNETKSLIATGGLELKKLNVPMLEIVIGPTIDSEEWLTPNSQNRYLISHFPYACEATVRRKFFECEKKDLFLRVTTKGFFHVVMPLFNDEKDDLYYFDLMASQISSILLFSIRIMKFYNLKSEQSIFITIRNIGGKKVTFPRSWSHWTYSFSNSLPEIEFSFRFSPNSDWKEIEKVLISIYRELCTEAGCIDIEEQTIKRRLYEILCYMQELHTEYKGEVILPRVDIKTFGLNE